MMTILEEELKWEGEDPPVAFRYRDMAPINGDDCAVKISRLSAHKALKDSKEYEIECCFESHT